MSVVKIVNEFFKLADMDDIIKLKSKLVLSDRQLKIMDFYYISRKNCNYIADTLYTSPDTIYKELQKIRKKIAKILQKEYKTDVIK